MNCLFCNNSIDLQWDTFHIPYYNKQCKYCYVDYHAERTTDAYPNIGDSRFLFKMEITAYCINFHYKGRPAKLLVHLNGTESRLWLDANDTYHNILLPKDFSTTITPQNIQSKIKTYLIFS